MARYRKPSPKATLFRVQDSDWIEVASPYSREWVDWVKRTLEPKNRYWSPERKRWGFRQSFLNEVVLSLQQHFFDLELEWAGEVEQARQDVLSESERLKREAVQAARNEILPEELDVFDFRIS